VTGGEPAEALAAATRLAAGAMLQRALCGDPALAGPHLLVSAAGRPGRAVALGGDLTVGRSTSSGLQLEDPGSSRRHARIRLERSGAATVEDLGSKNGLRLNGVRIRPGPAALRPGDELLIGETRLRFVDPLAEQGEVAPTATPAAAVPPWLLLAGSAALLVAAALALAAS
jgi:pSer/pThr/pTyr-binding forkhead associated (FHA) protein